MIFFNGLQLQRGLTAIIGGGGKTTLMYRLAKECRTVGTVLVCTSTHIRRPEGIPVLTSASSAAVLDALTKERCICLGTEAEGGKLCAPQLSFEQLTQLADFVLVEADGAKMLPLKAHLPHEPVIPENAGQTILVVGASAFGRKISEVCHRPELWARRAGMQTDQTVTPQALARLILHEGYGDRVFINQVESPRQLEAARTLAALLDRPVAAGSLFKEELLCLS